MATMSASDLRSWVGHTAIDNQGSKVGKITDIYMDQSSRQPEWLTVKTGKFGGNVSFVPLAGATPAGDDVKVAYDKDTIAGAPNIPAEGEISETEEDELYRYYGQGQAGAETGTREGTTRDAMTRSEEELEVGKRRREAGRARLHKWVETEDVQVTVPVEREKARMVTEPITDENRDAATSGPEISEADHEVTLREEEIDVSKRAVPKERVRLEKETETEQVPVSEQVRKEHIEREDEGGRS